QPLERHVAQADTAQLEAAVHAARPAALHAARVRAHAELRRLRCFDPPTFLRHFVSRQVRNGIPSAPSSALPCSSLRADVTSVTLIPSTFSTLSRSISGKMLCSRRPSV